MRTAARVAFTEISRERRRVAVAKLPHVVEHVRAALESVGKVVVMAHHHEVVDGLRDGLAEFGTVLLDGRTSTAPEVRQGIVERFQTDDAVRVFVGGIQAAGVGLTLTAASHVVFAELDWVPANISQAEDRCHRIGQHDSVLAQHIVLAGSLDERMAHITVEKQRLADASLDVKAAEEPALAFAEPATGKIRPNVMRASAVAFDPADTPAVHNALRSLASMCDGAVDLDGMGFNALDTYMGRRLAAEDTLTAAQAVVGLKIAMRYRRTQLTAWAGILEKIDARVSEQAKVKDKADGAGAEAGAAA